MLRRMTRQQAREEVSSWGLNPQPATPHVLTTTLPHKYIFFHLIVRVPHPPSCLLLSVFRVKEFVGTVSGDASAVAEVTVHNVASARSVEDGAERVFDQVCFAWYIAFMQRYGSMFCPHTMPTLHVHAPQPMRCCSGV